MVSICAWRACEATTSAQIAAPLCDNHAAQVYREVAALMRQSPRPPLTRPTVPSSARRNTKTQPGTIYFARFGDRVKIGFTTNLEQRLRTLRPDEVLATQPGTMRDEEALHHRFGHLWIEREMFELGPELSAHIDGLRRVP